MPDWIRVAAMEDCPPGSLLGVEVGEERIVLANVAGGFFALENRCSHADFPLSDGFLEGGRLECAHHGAQFDVSDGRAVRLPALRPVPTLEVEVRGFDLFVLVEE